MGIGEIDVICLKKRVVSWFGVWGDVMADCAMIARVLSPASVSLVVRPVSVLQYLADAYADTATPGHDLGVEVQRELHDLVGLSPSISF